MSLPGPTEIMSRCSTMHSGKEKLNEPKEYLFTGLRSKVLHVVESKTNMRVSKWNSPKGVFS